MELLEPSFGNPTRGLEARGKAVVGALRLSPGRVVGNRGSPLGLRLRKLAAGLTLGEGSEGERTDAGPRRVDLERALSREGALGRRSRSASIAADSSMGRGAPSDL